MNDINKMQKKDILLIDPRMLKIEDGFNTRIDYGNIDELMNSIIENGVKVPLRGYKDGEFYIITDGHRRLLSVRKAIENGSEIARIPFISERKKPMEERIFDIILSNDGKPLTPIELCETYKKLQNFGFSITEIAKKIGKTYKHVNDMLCVAESSKDIKSMIADKQISATLVAEIKSKVKDIEEAETIIKNATTNKTGKITKKDINQLKPKKKSYSHEQVKQLLRDQVKACADKIENPVTRGLIMTTKLVLTNEVTTEQVEH